jgi:hypothetical protein
VKASVAVLSFIFGSAAKYDVDEASLANELQQLGLPNENVSSLCKVYASDIGNLRGVLREKSLRISRFGGVDWRVDYVLSSSFVKVVEEPLVHMKLTIDSGEDEKDTVAFTMSGRKFQTLLSDLKQIRNTMDSLA